MQRDQIVIVTATGEGAVRHHDAIAAGVPVLCEVARDLGYHPITSEDASVLTAERLASAAAVIFHQVNGAVLTPGQRGDLAAFVQSGGGWMGVHNSSGAERDWADYRNLVQARFVRHPPLNDQPVGLRPHTQHPSVAHLPDPWRWSDEWYEFDRAPEAVVLLTLPEPEPGVAGSPLAWTHHWGRGRTWYTALGHRAEAYADQDFIAHLAGGLTSVLPIPDP